MELKVIRNPNSKATPGTLYVDGKAFCITLEDIDRGLTKDMPLSEIQKKKIHGDTCIPKGRYELAITYSNRFKQLLPLVINVPGFEGIRLHKGNQTSDTEGCLLLGEYLDGNKIRGGTSKPAFDKVFALLTKTLKKEKVFIEFV